MHVRSRRQFLRLATATSVVGLGLGAGPRAQVVDGSGRPNAKHSALHAWFDAAVGVNGGSVRDGEGVTSWVDATGKRRDLTRTSARAYERPTWRKDSHSGQAALEFDGDDYLWADRGRFSLAAGTRTVFVVARVRSADGGYVFDGTSSGARNAFFTGQKSAPHKWHVYPGVGSAMAGVRVDHNPVAVHSIVYAKDSISHFVNGRLMATSRRSGVAPMGGLVVGARYSLNFRLIGDVSELLFYSRALTSAEQLAIETYLMKRHTPPKQTRGAEHVRVFTSGDGRYHTYRIPSLLTTDKGTLLAFCEGRASRSDHAKNDMVLRRSSDGGKTWGKLQVLHDDGSNSLNNPCAVQIREGVNKGRVLLMYQRFPAGCHTRCVLPGYTGTKVCRTFVITSDDDGVTWSKPVEVTRQVKRPTSVRSTATGPGVGIQLRRGPKRGRIVMPFNQLDMSGRWEVYAVFSDDGGKSWTRGALAPRAAGEGYGNEVQMVERVDGSLMLNSRSVGGTKHRKVAISSDSGASWSTLKDDLKLNEPQVMASIVRFTDPLDGFKTPRLAFSCPNSRLGRVHGTVYTSRDEGKSWRHSKVISPGFSAYSCLAVVDGRELGCLFETNSYGSIDFYRMSSAWLSDGRDCLANGRHQKRYGAGCKGSGQHVPALALEGCASPGYSIRFTIDRGLGGSVALLMLGTTRTNFAIGGCLLLVSPIALALGPVPLRGVGAGAGRSELPLKLPITLGALTFTAQAVLLDTGVARGFTSTDALDVSIF